MLTDMSKAPEHAFKTLTGWVVTRSEPTGDQRSAVQSLQAPGISLYIIGFSGLHRRLCDSEKYLALRAQAPFGSTAYTENHLPKNKVDVPATYASNFGAQKNGADVASLLLDGHRALVTGEYGVGKSHAMRDLYLRLRKLHFKSEKLTPFPLHINLKDCIGLRSPTEILARHAETIGFDSARSLNSAWRSGSCILLLDGFDEIIPSRWLGSAADLRDYRWLALAPIRTMIAETPPETGLAISGRSNYFSSHAERDSALGLHSSTETLTLQDFDIEQLTAFLTSTATASQIPEWMPTKPLLLGYLVGLDHFELADAPSSSSSQGQAWRQMLDLICAREAEMLTAVRPESIKRIVSRVATLARANGEAIGPVSADVMKAAYVAVNGRQPDEEGMQLLQRLPGLASSGDGTDDRVFADEGLSETAFGEDLATYAVSPHAGHPLEGTASWVSASSELGLEVAALALQELEASQSAYGAVKARQDAGQYDAVSADLLRISGATQLAPKGDKRTYVIEGVIFDTLLLAEDDELAARITFNNCLFERLDLSGIETAKSLPTFRNCDISAVDGISGFTVEFEARFPDCTVEHFSEASQTTAGIMSLKLAPRNRVALSILKKTYSQRGSGRKEGSLSRGLDPQSRQLVPEIVSSLVSSGWLLKSSAGHDVIYAPIKSRKVAALAALANPATFSLA